MLSLAVDCMGGDHSLKVTLPACKTFLDKQKEANLLLVGSDELKKNWKTHERAKIISASEVVEMDDSIEIALRRKKDSSMRVAINQVKEGLAQVVVSSGNTGALLAVSRFVLKTLPGIDRPAIASQVPNRQDKTTTLLDLGANVDCQPDHLMQFAILGSAFLSVLEPESQLKVGLLNVGEEEIKGNNLIKQTIELLRLAHESKIINFIGSCEGNNIFDGSVDIVVCDGFVGNVALKTAEGIASMISSGLKQEFQRNILNKSVALLAMPVLKSLTKRIDHKRYNGAALLGLKGLVFKSHGGADEIAFEWALHRAFMAAKNNLLEKIQNNLNHAEEFLYVNDR